jgi:hypothetical protein
MPQAHNPKRPSAGAIALGAVPFAAMCFSVALWDRVHPMVLGLPFNLFWLICWIALTPVFMGIAYRLEKPRRPGGTGKEVKSDRP